MKAAAAEKHTVVVGGGWAGLAAAVELVHHDIPVTLYEASRQLGGRARCVRFGALRVDNGQHLMTGAYRGMLRLMQRLNVDEDEIFLRQPLHLQVRARTGVTLDLQFGDSGLLGRLRTLLTARGLGWAGRLGIARLVRIANDPTRVPDPDIDVQALFERTDQSQRAVDALWTPLCLGALNTAPKDASAQVFLRVLAETFTDRPGTSDLLLPRTDLGTAIPEPALDAIERRGGQVRLAQRVQGLHVEQGRLQGIRVSGKDIPVRNLVLAVPPVAALRLLGTHAEAGPVVRSLRSLDHAPICTVYLQYAPHIKLDRAMLGIQDGIGQWVFDRRVCDQPGLMAVVVSSHGPHMSLSNEELGREVAAQLGLLNPDWPAPERILTIREKRATFLCRPGIDRDRPGVHSGIESCWLAGDFTATGLPSTLEGAIRSGLECAETILDTYSE